MRSEHTGLTLGAELGKQKRSRIRSLGSISGLLGLKVREGGAVTTSRNRPGCLRHRRADETSFSQIVRPSRTRISGPSSLRLRGA